MQNTVIQQAELQFWRILYPLIQHSVPLKKFAHSLVETTRKSVIKADDLLEERFQNIYLLICVLCGLAALGIGYAVAWLLGR